MHRQTLWWNAQHFPTTKHTWGAAEEQEQSRLIPLTQTTVPTCVTRAGQTPIPPQLGPLPIHAVVLHDDVTESWIRHQGGRTATEMCARSRATRKAAQEQFESGETCSGKTHSPHSPLCRPKFTFTISTWLERFKSEGGMLSLIFLANFSRSS